MDSSDPKHPLFQVVLFQELAMELSYEEASWNVLFIPFALGVVNKNGNSVSI